MALEETFQCPYCASVNSLTIDYSGGNEQEFVNDCETCCQPILIHISVDESDACLNVKKENE